MPRQATIRRLCTCILGWLLATICMSASDASVGSFQPRRRVRGSSARGQIADSFYHLNAIFHAGVDPIYSCALLTLAGSRRHIPVNYPSAARAAGADRPSLPAIRPGITSQQSNRSRERGHLPILRREVEIGGSEAPAAPPHGSTQRARNPRRSSRLIQQAPALGVNLHDALAGVPVQGR